MGVTVVRPALGSQCEGSGEAGGPGCCGRLEGGEAGGGQAQPGQGDRIDEDTAVLVSPLTLRPLPSSGRLKTPWLLLRLPSRLLSDARAWHLPSPQSGPSSPPLAPPGPPLHTPHPAVQYSTVICPSHCHLVCRRCAPCRTCKSLTTVLVRHCGYSARVELPGLEQALAKAARAGTHCDTDTNTDTDTGAGTGTNTGTGTDTDPEEEAELDLEPQA